MQDHSIDALLDEVRAIALTGLSASSDNFDLDRYNTLIEISHRHYAQTNDSLKRSLRRHASSELGVITPKLGVSATVFDRHGQLLLVQRTDSDTWCLPCGWTDVCESPESALRREVMEETGLRVEILHILRRSFRLPGEYDSSQSSIHLQYICKAVGGSLRGSSETKSVNYYAEGEKTDWHHDHAIEAAAAFDYWRLQNR